MTDTLFSPAEVTTDANTSPIGEYDPNVDYKAQLVGEGKKYAEDNMLAYSRLVADQHIKKLEREQAAVRQELQSRITVEEALEKLQQKPINDNRQPVDSENGRTNTSALSEDQIAALVNKELNRFSTERSRSENLKEAQDGLRKSFGDNYRTKLEETTVALGTNKEFMDNLAATNPKAFLRMVGAEGTSRPVVDGTTPPRSTAQVPPVRSTDKKWSDFEKLRKEKPGLYWTPSVQNELEKLVTKHGEDFYKT